MLVLEMMIYTIGTYFLYLLHAVGMHIFYVKGHLRAIEPGQRCECHTYRITLLSTQSEVSHCLYNTNHFQVDALVTPCQYAAENNLIDV